MNEERKEGLAPEANENFPVCNEAEQSGELQQNEQPSIEPATDPDQTPKFPAPSKAKKTASKLFDYLELFAWSVFTVLIIFTFGIRLCRVDGQSMENTLYDKQNLLIYSTAYEPQQGDIIVFHLTSSDGSTMQKTLVKRVIATGGQEVVINTKENTITVDGVRYDDENAVLKDRFTDQITGEYRDYLFHYSYDSASGIFKTTVPEGSVFVLGDNRNNSTDSRSPDVGFVDERCVLGKVVVRLRPFTVFA